MENAPKEQKPENNRRKVTIGIGTASLLLAAGAVIAPHVQETLNTKDHRAAAERMISGAKCELISAVDTGERQRMSEAKFVDGQPRTTLKLEAHVTRSPEATAERARYEHDPSIIWVEGRESQMTARVGELPVRDVRSSFDEASGLLTATAYPRADYEAGTELIIEEKQSVIVTGAGEGGENFELSESVYCGTMTFDGDRWQLQTPELQAPADEFPR